MGNQEKFDDNHEGDADDPISAELRAVVRNLEGGNPLETVAEAVPVERREKGTKIEKATKLEQAKLEASVKGVQEKIDLLKDLESQKPAEGWGKEVKEKLAAVGKFLAKEAFIVAASGIGGVMGGRNYEKLI